MPRKPRAVVSWEQRQEANRKRRLNAYPKAFFDLIEVAKTRGSATAVYEEHNRATGIQMRYYRFRADAIEDRIPDAMELRALSTTGINGDGTLFSSRRPEAPGPYTIYWRYYEDMAVLPLSKEVQAIIDKYAAQPPAGVIRSGGVGDESASEKAVMAYLNRGKKPEETRPSADEPSLDIPTLDLNPQGPPLPTCPPHELDPATETRCIKCGLPEPEWPK